MISDISKWRITSSNCKYLSACFAIRLRTEIRERFHIFYFVFVLITNENRMHAQRFAEESALLSCKRTRYSRISHVLTILSLRFKSEFSSRIDLQESSSSSSSSSSFSSSSSSSSQISVRLHGCRVRHELYTFTNKSSRSRIMSIDERRRSNELIASRRSWEKTRDNVTSVHRIQHGRINIELTSLSYHIEC